jgi:hypothetical protein
MKAELPSAALSLSPDCGRLRRDAPGACKGRTAGAEGLARGTLGSRPKEQWRGVGRPPLRVIQKSAGGGPIRPSLPTRPSGARVRGGRDSLLSHASLIDMGRRRRRALVWGDVDAATVEELWWRPPSGLTNWGASTRASARERGSRRVRRGQRRNAHSAARWSTRAASRPEQRGRGAPALARDAAHLRRGLPDLRRLPGPGTSS